MMYRNTKYEGVIAAIQQGNFLAEMSEGDLTPEQIKQAVIHCLSPYFEQSQTLLDQSLSLLLPEVVNLSRLDAWALDLCNECLNSHRLAKSTDSQSSLEAATVWLQNMQHGMSIYWSLARTERDKDALELPEFVLECSQTIGALVEAAIQPYLKELLHQVRIHRRKEAGQQKIEPLKLGNVVQELIDTAGYPDFFKPAPWAIPIHQWRNVAQHYTADVDGEHIILEYHTNSGPRQLTLSRDDLLDGARKLVQIFSAIKLAHTFYVIDNLNDIRAANLIPQEIRVRPEALVLNFASQIASQKFQLVDFKWNETETIAVIKDLSQDDPKERRLHVSQFPYLLWQHIENERTIVEYWEKGGTPVPPHETVEEGRW